MGLITIDVQEISVLNYWAYLKPIIVALLSKVSLDSLIDLLSKVSLDSFMGIAKVRVSHFVC